MLGASEARADASTIVLVTSSRHTALEHRLRAELLSLDFRVEEIDTAEPRVSLEQLARRRGAIAAMRVTTAGEAVEIWVASREPDAARSREFVPVSRRRGVDVNAISAVEVLRARLVKLGHARELGAPDPAPRSEPVPELEPEPSPLKPPLVTPVPAGNKVFWAALGAGASYSPGGLRTNPVLVGGIRVAAASWVSTAVFLSWQPMPRTVLEAEGQADVRASFIGVGLDFPLRFNRLETSLGAGGALVFVTMRGHATAPYRGTDDSVFAPAPVLRFGMVWKGSDHLGLRGDLLGGVSVPRVAVRFDQRPTHYWGRPFVVAALGIELGLF